MSWAADNPELYEELRKAVTRKLGALMRENGFEFDADTLENIRVGSPRLQSLRPKRLLEQDGYVLAEGTV